MGEAAMSAFLGVLLQRVQSLLDCNLQISRKLRALKSLLLKVNKVLKNNDAEVKQITDNLVKEWLRRLQDAAYESNELLDAIINAEKTRNKVELASTEGELKKILQKLNDIVGEQACLHGGPDPKKPYWHRTSLKDEDKMYGRHDDRESMVKLLLAENSSDNSPDVITIIGMGGIGKTTLAQHVYDDDQIVKHFDFRAWFCVSEGLNVLKVTKTILEKATLSPSFTDDLSYMQEQLRSKLVSQKFLVVLDDVWEENRCFWDELKKPLKYGLRGSKVIVTTRNEGVGQIMRTVPTYYLEKLSDEDCWELFAKHAFEDGDSQPHQSFIDMGREIMKKCHGLPLAAKEFGILLKQKKTKVEWSKIMKSNVWDLKCDIISQLLVSYLYLPARLKCCFAFASIFPKDYEFEKEELIQLWAAQSFFPEGENAQDTGNEYFNELISRSFFQQSAGSEPLFVMHNFMHDLATLASGQSCRCCVDLEDIQGITTTTRHMSYSITVLRQNLPNINTLRTFTQLKKHNQATPPKLCLDGLLTQFKLLRVLSLRGCEIAVLTEKIGNLKHLRCLDLSGTKIKTLPDSMGNLYNLETLILTDCRELTELPTAIRERGNLHLDVTGCNQLSN